MPMTLTIRGASRTDRDALRALQARSMRELGRACYDDDVIEAFIAHVGTMDDRLLDDGTFFSAYVDDALAGCGGWSSRTPNYAAHMPQEAVQALRPQATVRSVFVDPRHARRGIARRLMAAIEADIAAAGHDRAALGSTLTGIPFYRKLGYRGGTPVLLRMPGDLLFVGLGMSKPLPRAERVEDEDAA